MEEGLHPIFADLFSPSSLSDVRQLGTTWDVLSAGLRQSTNFQLSLFDGLTRLAERVEMLQGQLVAVENQIFNIDQAVVRYFDENPVRMFTRDGIPIDDAIDSIHEKLKVISEKLGDHDASIQRVDAVASDCVSKETFIKARITIEEANESASSAASSMDQIRRDVTILKRGDAEKWDAVNSIIKEQLAQYSNQLDDKVEQSDLDDYVKHTDLAQIKNLFQSIPEGRTYEIKEILPKIFALPDLTMEERINKAYELLKVERNRVDLEDRELDEELSKLKELMDGKYSESSTRDVEVRDICIGPEGCQVGEIRYTLMSQGGPRFSVETFFDGPENCFAIREHSSLDLQDLRRTSAKEGGMNASELTSAVLSQCQGIIERQMELVLRAMGIKIDRSDIIQLIGQLSIVEEIQRDTEAMKRKLLIKVDQSTFANELKLYLTREEFFTKCCEAGIKIQEGPIPRSTSEFGKVSIPIRQVHSRKAKERKVPLPLVPARSPMMSVNEKFLKGKDNKLYLREMSGIGDKSYKEPTPVGMSYYERSRRSGELVAVEAIVDFQPFVPSDDVRASTSQQKVRVETYGFSESSVDV